MNTDSGNEGSQNTQSQTISDVYDKQEAIRKLGSETLLQKVTFLFLSNASGHMDTIKQAIEEGDSETLLRSAHTFVSSMAYFSAQSASQAARALEDLGRSGDLSNVEPAYDTLKSEIGRLKEALAQLLPEEGRPRES